ncbi:MAG: hypothetical protein LBS56_10890 [Propionibacteriaceae bacterium]|nr:hypothetical protein [Propionibacteriaceae bacterium]
MSIETARSWNGDLWPCSFHLDGRARRNGRQMPAILVSAVASRAVPTAARGNPAESPDR